MKSLSHLQFDTLLDIGGAEGYKAALARSIFNVKVRSCDLSIEACNKAKEIFDIDGEPVDIHRLPYSDNEFDVVLCSETLEHVQDIQQATRELIRVCRNAVVITVPYEPKKVIERNIKENIPHAHIHSFDTRSFDFCLPAGYRIISRKMLSPFLRRPFEIVDAEKIQESKKLPQILLNIYNSLAPAFQVIFGRRTASFLIKIDDFLSNSTPFYSGMSFIILKNNKCYSGKEQKKISASQIIDFKVPYHYISATEK